MRSTRHCMRKVERLVSGANRPAPEAFAELVRSNSKLIYKMSLRILKNHSDAEDNLQNNIHRFEGRSQLSSWLVRIAINEALMKIRKHRLADTVRRIEAATQDQNCEALKIEDAWPDLEHQCIPTILVQKPFVP